MTRLLWLAVLGICAVAKFLVEWLEEYARKRVRGDDGGEDEKERS